MNKSPPGGELAALAKDTQRHMSFVTYFPLTFFLIPPTTEKILFLLDHFLTLLAKFFIAVL